MGSVVLLEFTEANCFSIIPSSSGSVLKAQNLLMKGDRNED